MSATVSGRTLVMGRGPALVGVEFVPALIGVEFVPARFLAVLFEECDCAQSRHRLPARVPRRRARTRLAGLDSRCLCQSVALDSSMLTPTLRPSLPRRQAMVAMSDSSLAASNSESRRKPMAVVVPARLREEHEWVTCAGAARR